MSVMQRCIVILALVAVPFGTADAQRKSTRRAQQTAPGPRLGPHFGYNFDAESGFIGAQAIFPLAPAFELYPSFDFYFTQVGSAWALNFDFRYRPRSRYGLFYVGAGLNYLRQSEDGFGYSNTNLGFMAGVENRRSRVAPFGELRLTVGDGSSFQATGGLSWKL